MELAQRERGWLTALPIGHDAIVFEIDTLAQATPTPVQMTSQALHKQIKMRRRMFGCFFLQQLSLSKTKCLLPLLDPNSNTSSLSLCVYPLASLLRKEVNPIFF